MLCEGGSAGLEAVLVNGFGRETCARLQTIPAAPPPTMTTFFLPFLSSPSDDMRDESEVVKWSANEGERGRGMRWDNRWLADGGTKGERE